MDARDDIVFGVGVPFGEYTGDQRTRSHGRGEYGERRHLVTLPLDQFTHAHFIGTTGFGKSTLMVSLAAQLIEEGVGVALVDPAGDISRRVLIELYRNGFYTRYADAFDRFVYLDIPRAHRVKRYLAFNILAGDYDPHTAASIVMEAYRRVWPTMQDGSWGNIELMTTLAAVVLAYNKLPLLPFLEDFYRFPAFRERLLSQVRDTRVAQWLELLEVKPGNPKLPAIVDTTLKRLMLIALPPVVGYPLSQRDNLLDGKHLLATNRSIALNLNMEDEQAIRLLGALFTRQMETAIKTRVYPGTPRRSFPYVVMLDEVQHFMAQSAQAVDTMFAEARRAGVFVVAAHQYWGQLPLGTAGSFSQCGIVAVFAQKPESGRLSVEHIGLPIDLDASKTIWSGLHGPRTVALSVPDQVAGHVDNIDKLLRGSAFLRLPGNKLYALQTVPTDPNVDEAALAVIEEEYIRRFFNPLAEINAWIGRVRSSDDQTGTSQALVPNATLQPPPPPPVHPTPPAKQPPRQLPKPSAPTSPPPPETREEQPPQAKKRLLDGRGEEAGF